MSENTENVQVADKSEFAAFDGLLNLIKSATDDANADAKRRKDLIAQSKGAVDSILNDSDDEQIVKYREFRDAIEAKIAELTAKRDDAKAQAVKFAESLVPEVSDETLSNLKDSYLTKRQGVTAAKTTLLLMMGNDEATLKRALEAYGVTEVISSAGGGTKVAGTTGIVRKRLSEASYNGEPVADKDGKTSFTLLSGKSGISGDDIRDAMAKAANVESVKDIDSDTTVEFTIEHDGKSHVFKVTTK